MLSASEFLDRVALLIPPPRKHRHRFIRVAGAELAVSGAGDGADWPEAGGGEQGTAAKDNAHRLRGHAIRTPGAIFVGTMKSRFV